MDEPSDARDLSVRFRTILLDHRSDSAGGDNAGGDSTVTLDRLRNVSDRMLPPFVDVAVRLGLTPNVITVLSFLLAVAAAVALYLGGSEPVWYLPAAVLVALSGFLDILDGAVARETGVASPAGDFLDHTLDRYGDVVILGGLAAGVEQYELGLIAITGVLLTAYLGTQAQAVGLGRIYGGLLGRADIMALTSATAIAAVWIRTEFFGLTLVGLLLVLFAIVSHVTAIQRFVRAWRRLRADGE